MDEWEGEFMSIRVYTNLVCRKNCKIHWGVFLRAPPTSQWCSYTLTHLLCLHLEHKAVGHHTVKLLCSGLLSSHLTIMATYSGHL